MKKYLKSMSLGSPAMNPFAPCSIGSLMPTPNDLSAPAPSWPAAMMPGPAPVITIQPRSAIARENSRVVAYSAWSSVVRAEPKMLTFRTPRYGAKMRNERPNSRSERDTSFISPRFAVRAIRNAVATMSSRRSASAGANSPTSARIFSSSARSPEPERRRRRWRVGLVRTERGSSGSTPVGGASSDSRFSVAFDAIRT